MVMDLSASKTSFSAFNPGPIFMKNSQKRVETLPERFLYPEFPVWRRVIRHRSRGLWKSGGFHCFPLFTLCWILRSAVLLVRALPCLMDS
jgi:hypothetical protein